MVSEAARKRHTVRPVQLTRGPDEQRPGGLSEVVFAGIWDGAAGVLTYERRGVMSGVGGIWMGGWMIESDRVMGMTKPVEVLG